VDKARAWNSRGHFFAAAEALGVSPRTASSVWAYARA
jgi:hypothetical protein